jgi:hypothetical protein
MFVGYSSRSAPILRCGNGGIAIHRGEIEEKVVVLRELHRAIIYTTEISNQVTKTHVRMQFTVYLVN